jgi:hypothetical protein
MARPNRQSARLSELDQTVRRADAAPGAEVEAASRVNVAVAVADDARICIFEVAAACRALGFEHTATLTTVGILTGSVEFDRLADLRAVPGVVAVEVERQRPERITARGDYQGRLN